MCIKRRIIDIDKIIDKFKNGDLICIASRPCVGKTTFAYKLSINITNRQIPILIFSLENAKKLVQTRINEIISKEGKAEIKETVEKNTYILDNVLNIADIEQNAKLVKSQRNIKLVIIDYLQLIKTDGTMDEVIIRLKALAQKLNVPIIILSQLSRKIELRKNKKPLLSDFEKSSAIVDYANIIIFLYKDTYKLNDNELHILLSIKKRGDKK